MTYPKCDRPDGCNGRHSWHGLPCGVHTNPLVGKGTAGPCNCPGAFDDDYWKDGPT